MRNAAPLTFGARLAAHLQTTDDVKWFFNVPQEVSSDAPPQLPEPVEQDHLIQIGPLDT